MTELRVQNKLLTEIIKRYLEAHPNEDERFYCIDKITSSIVKASVFEIYNPPFDFSSQRLLNFFEISETEQHELEQFIKENYKRNIKNGINLNVLQHILMDISRIWKMPHNIEERAFAEQYTTLIFSNFLRDIGEKSRNDLMRKQYINLAEITRDRQLTALKWDAKTLVAMKELIDLVKSGKKIHIEDMMNKEIRLSRKNFNRIFNACSFNYDQELQTFCGEMNAFYYADNSSMCNIELLRQIKVSDFVYPNCQENAEELLLGYELWYEKRENSAEKKGRQKQLKS